MTRIVIAGGPKTGKTTLGNRIASDMPRSEVHHTDAVIDLGWSEASAGVATWFDRPGPWCIEGVAVPRALRKWLAAHAEGKPCDVVIWLEEPHEERTPGQVTMARGCATVFAEIEGELRARGVEIRFGAEPAAG